MAWLVIHWNESCMRTKQLNEQTRKLLGIRIAQDDTRMIFIVGAQSGVSKD